MKQRLDQSMVQLGLVPTRSQAESFIKMGDVKLNGRVVTKPGLQIGETDKVELLAKEQYVSRAALKLASVALPLNLDFSNKTVLDVGSSTGGFTDYALRHGAARVIAVDVGSEQMHSSLRKDARVELHEKTDIRQFNTEQAIDLVVADVSFISLRDILPAVAKLCQPYTLIVVMVKPQFEAAQSNMKHKGVIKNDKMRRSILKDFENWVRRDFIIINKADSAVAGAQGNQERFYILRKA